MPDEYYVRYAGKRTGPYTVEQVRESLRLGRISLLHEVSTDRAKWTPIQDMPQLRAVPAPEAPAEPALAQPEFEDDPGTADLESLGLEDDEEAVEAVRTPEETWFLAVSGRLEGPYPTSRILGLLGEGSITADDMVTPSKDEPWRAIRDHPSFAGHLEDTGGESYATLALTALILSLVGILVPVCGAVGLVCGVVGVSYMRAVGNDAGKGLAVAGIVIGAINTIADPFKIMWLVGGM
jgi:hypothetical protein